ncbi:hypothetical protein AMAG_03766 [Allomyces macrogynus ATCC 38327]|uniref:Uncharacterized protein n=1 Tax=Allomyces macrogynus (strain ATCC 38327) TaxID=578462 RepID=A0A0L0SAJ5_ALLM3|nr:hypothetical protein AMAG_03766 [Allomyces macrogynus ATCC 38327]|eukprot:KNE59491.1 hypothetical protein AMAG_03766 [Allomyces macrogynus ATCC 38327]
MTTAPPPIVHLQATPAIRDLLHAVYASSAAQASGLAGELAAYLDNDRVPLTLLHRCHEHGVQCLGRDKSLYAVTRGARVALPPPPTSTDKSPALQRILDDIRRDQERKEYERMAGHALPGPRDGSDAPVIPRETRRTFLAITNVFYTAISVFVAVYYIGATVADDIAWQVLVAFLLAMLVLGGEAWLAYRSGDQRKMA